GGEVGHLLNPPRHVRHLEVEHIARDQQRDQVDHQRHTADQEEQRRFVVPFAAPAGAERPLPVQDVGHDGGHHDGERLRRRRLLLEHGELERVPDDVVDDERGGADDRELELLPVLDQHPAQRLRHAREQALHDGHGTDSQRTVTRGSLWAGPCRPCWGGHGMALVSAPVCVTSAASRGTCARRRGSTAAWGSAAPTRAASSWWSSCSAATTTGSACRCWAPPASTTATRWNSTAATRWNSTAAQAGATRSARPTPAWRTPPDPSTAPRTAGPRPAAARASNRRSTTGGRSGRPMRCRCGQRP